MLRQIAASIAIALVALSVAAIVVAQDPGGQTPAADQGTSEMRVLKLPPTNEDSQKVEVIKLDHFGQGTVSRARLLGTEQTFEQPDTLPEVQGQPLEISRTEIQEIDPANIAAAKQQAAAQARTLSSSTQRDMGVVLAADWSASSKVRGGLLNPSQSTEQRQYEQQPAKAPVVNNGEPNSHRTTNTLQDKLNGLRDAFLGNDTRQAPVSNQSTRVNNQPHLANQPTQVAPSRSQSAASNTPSVVSDALLGQTDNSVQEEPQQTAPALPVVRSTAPDPPGIPRMSSRNSSTGTPTLAESPSQSVAARPQSSAPLESSRQRRSPADWNDRQVESNSTASTSSPGTFTSSRQSAGSAVVASEPIAPAVPQMADNSTAVHADSTSSSASLRKSDSALSAMSSRTKGSVLPQGENVLMTVSGPQLSAQAVGPRRIVISQKAEFQVTVTNSGSVAANDVVVSVQLPNWVDVLSTEPSHGTANVPASEQAEQPLLWRIARLEANSSEMLKINLVPRRSQPLDMSVRWTYAQTATNALVEVEEPMLQMVISGPGEAVYGQTKLYNLTLSNPGSGDAHNVVLSLLPLEGKQEAPVSTKVGTLGRGETKTIQIELSAGKAGVLLVKANAAADGGLTAEASKEVLVRRANLVVEVVAPEAEYAGNAANYLLRIVNDGNAPAEDVTVNAVLPDGAEFVNSSGDGRLEEKQGRVRWDIGSLPAGQMREYRLSAKLHTPGANRLHSTAQDKSDLSAVADVQTAVIARADLKLLVTDPKGPVPVGEEAVYELTIRNRGTDAAEAVEAVIFFSEGIEPVRVEGADHEIGSGQVVFKTIPKIAANGELVLKIVARADQPGNHVFRAEVLCRSIGTKLAAEETTHFYGKELTAEASRPVGRTASRPTPAMQRLPGQTGSSPSPLPPAQIETK